MSGIRGEVGGPINRDPSDDRWFDTVGTAMSEIKIAVSVERARQVPVVRDCLKVQSDSVAGLQFGVFRRVGPATVERVTDHPILALFEDPNDRMTSFDLFYSMVDDLATEGNFYAEPVIDDQGRISRLMRLLPGSMQVEELLDGSRRYRYSSPSGRERRFLEGEIWHIAMPPFCDNLRGRSPILEDGREAVAVAIALQRYANILFTNDATPLTVLSMEGTFRDRDQKKNFLAAWRRWVTGSRRHHPAVLEHGMKAQRLGLTAEEAQFLETRKELWLDLTRIWRVPPHKVGIMDRATFSNIEHQSLEFVTDTLRPILELIERSVTKYLIEEPGTYFEFDVSSLLRGDIEARYKAYALGRQWGWLSVNDILRAENRNGIGPAGDRYIEPLNMVPVGTGAPERAPERRDATARAVAFLHQSVAGPRGGQASRLEIIRDAA